MFQDPIMHQPSGAAHQPAGHAGPDLDLIFDLAPLSVLILSPAWRIRRASSRFLSVWRVAAEDCLGQELLPFLERKFQPPRPAHLAHLTSIIDDAIASRAERTTHPINASAAVSWKIRVIPVFNRDELVSLVLEWHDGPRSTLPEIDQKEELVKPGLSTDEAFRILVQAVKDYAIFLLDTKGHIVTWNTGAELLKGYKREDIIGKHFSVFYGKEDLDIKKPQMELEICMREGRVEDEGWRYRKDGSRFWANVVITAVYKDGVHVGFGKVTRDLTERKSAESRLIAAYEESEKLKSDFLANMSHEIRTPMHGMLSACTLLLDTPLSARQRDIVNIMDESGQVLLQVINDILDYSKLASGSFTINSDIVGITSIVTSVVRGVQTSLPPSVHFELFLAPELPRSVQGDPLRYRQILQNIVGNAAKFTDKGSIRVRASVQSEDDVSYLVLTEVTDTGIGVPESAQASLFTPFMQFDTTTTKQYKGTGLGLSIAKSLTELMGGRIGYRPNPDRHGSVFWFTARFKKIKTLEQMANWKNTSTAARSERQSTPALDSEVEELQKELRIVSSIKNLLVVEDNLINQKVILGMLRSLGFRNVGLASNGLEAVRMVRGKPAAYDAVLMDVSMPVMDGQQATKEIRAGGVLVPIIAMTAYALKGDRERCLEYGMNDYIAKPVDKKRLISVLGKWLLRTTDYRKNYEQRLAEFRRQNPVLVPATPGDEAKQFLFDVTNGAGTQSAEEPKSEPSPLRAADGAVAGGLSSQVANPAAESVEDSQTMPTGTAATEGPNRTGDRGQQIEEPTYDLKTPEFKTSEITLPLPVLESNPQAGAVEEAKDFTDIASDGPRPPTDGRAEESSRHTKAPELTQDLPAETSSQQAGTVGEANGNCNLASAEPRLPIDERVEEPNCDIKTAEMTQDLPPVTSKQQASPVQEAKEKPDTAAAGPPPALVQCSVQPSDSLGKNTASQSVDVLEQPSLFPE
ncbi:hypothetical protein N657DRAFT_648016 [Parathielavia appendiculata]|uniref:Two-component system protein A n=1 Tax=Parathielavia appendiculata TaxID=2587402 RepID=A0AAN6TUX1_9PEZI|nr:hypothetical protein N657DRAFT_648016 [Parathielavia appendiculata]